jgi:predicted DNA-binding transcriptional regulator YafY
VQRQLEMLVERFDIECDDRSKPYGYRWKERTKGLSLQVLSEQESLLLILAEQHLKNLLPSPLMKSMESFFIQARSNLGPPGDAKLERQWLSKVRVVSETQRLLPPKVQPGVMEDVSQALYANKLLNLEYRNASGVQSKAEVMPLGLAQQGPRMYLVCRFVGFDNERSLALHRIVSTKVSTLSFERPKDFDLKKYDDDGRFGFGEGKQIRLFFTIEKLAGNHLLETPLSADQTVKDMGDQLRISATVIDSEHLDWWLRGFGDQVDGIRKTVINNSKK